MRTVFRLLVRLLVLLAAGLFALSLLFAAVLVLALWGLRALWARLTGQPVAPFVLRAGPGAGFGYAFRSYAGPFRPRAGGPAPGVRDGQRTAERDGTGARLADIEDVEPKPPRG